MRSLHLVQVSGDWGGGALTMARTVFRCSSHCFYNDTIVACIPTVKGIDIESVDSLSVATHVLVVVYGISPEGG